MGVISSIESGVADTGWYEELHGFAQVNYGMLVELNDPSSLRVEVVRDRDLARARGGTPRVGQLLTARLEDAMPPSFNSSIDVATTGITYLSEEFVPGTGRKPLIVKLDKDPRLAHEHNAAFNALTPYVQRPEKRMAFNIVIGNVLLSAFTGGAKIDLRFGLSDHGPK